MKQALFLTVVTLGSALATDILAQTYQWKDSSGRTIISDTPPPRNARESRTLGTAPAPNIGDTPKAANEAKSTAEKDAEFRKRQQDAKEKAEKAAKEQTAARERQDICERARRNLAALESDQSISMPNERGEAQVIDKTQRAQEIERAQKIVSEACK